MAEQKGWKKWAMEVLKPFGRGTAKAVEDGVYAAILVGIVMIVVWISAEMAISGGLLERAFASVGK